MDMVLGFRIIFFKINISTYQIYLFYQETVEINNRPLNM